LDAEVSGGVGGLEGEGDLAGGFREERGVSGMVEG
jgi:hypothetical protein